METQTHTYSEIKNLYEGLEDFSIDSKEAIENMIEDKEDFMIDDYRFIKTNCIDGIQQDELKSDPYMLGCFNGDFISDNTDLSYGIVKALQEGDRYQELGQHIIDNDYLEDMQSEYARLDGYGHHFAHYDHDEHEVGEYYVFRTN